MNTEELMDIALELAGQERIPDDSEIYVRGENIQKILMGIDIGEAELLLAKDVGYDAAIAHHPCGGNSLLSFHNILEKHFSMMVAHGVPREMARQAVEELKLETDVSNHAHNYDRTPSFARLLRMPFLNIHNPLDELGRRTMDEVVRRNCDEDSTVGNLIEALSNLPEFKKAQTEIKIRMGSAGNRCGSFVVAHSAGTNGGYPVARAYFKAGIDTVLYIHISHANLMKLKNDKELHGKKNLVISGHIASDSVGINQYVRRLRREGLEVTCIGGIVEA